MPAPQPTDHAATLAAVYDVLRRAAARAAQAHEKAAGSSQPAAEEVRDATAQSPTSA